MRVTHHAENAHVVYYAGASSSQATIGFPLERMRRIWARQPLLPENTNPLFSPSLSRLPYLLVTFIRGVCLPPRSTMNKTQVERILEYTKDVPQEAAPVVQGRRPEPKWPADGALTVKNLTVQ